MNGFTGSFVADCTTVRLVLLLLDSVVGSSCWGGTISLGMPLRYLGLSWCKLLQPSGTFLAPRVFVLLGRCLLCREGDLSLIDLLVVPYSLGSQTCMTVHLRSGFVIPERV